MSEAFTLLSSDSNGFSSGSPASAIFDTKGKKNFALFVVIPPMGATSSELFDGSLEECDTDAFTSNEVFTCRMTKPDGTAATAIDQAAGDDTAGNAALLQKFNLPDTNYSRYIRFNATVGGTAADVVNVRVFITYDLIKRTTL